MKMLALVASLVCTSSLAAAEIEFLNMPLPAPYAQRVPVADLNDAQREAEARELRGMLERRIDRPLREKKLRAAIAMTEAEIASLERLIAEYEHISRPLYSNPFLYTLEAAKLARLEALLRLDQLRFEKQAFDENFHALRRLERLQR